MALAITIICSVFLFTLVNNSEAIEITSLYPSNGQYYNYAGYLYPSACVETDEPFSDVWWYINDVHVGTSNGDINNPQTTACFSAGSFYYPGSPFGTSYEVKAVVQSFMDENGNIDQDTDSYTAYVYTTPDVDKRQGFHTGAQGDASANAGWNGSTAEATISGSITNNGIHDISYVMNLFYAVGKLQADGNLDENNLFDQPDGIQILHGSINANDESQSVSFPSFSDSFEVTFFGQGDSFGVQASMSIAAWISGQEQDEDNTDRWFASMSSTWNVEE